MTALQALAELYAFFKDEIPNETSAFAESLYVLRTYRVKLTNNYDSLSGMKAVLDAQRIQLNRMEMNVHYGLVNNDISVTVEHMHGDYTCGLPLHSMSFFALRHTSGRALAAQVVGNLNMLTNIEVPTELETYIELLRQGSTN